MDNYFTKLKDWIFWKYWAHDLTAHYTWARYSMIDWYWRKKEGEEQHPDWQDDYTIHYDDMKLEVEKARKRRIYYKFFNIVMFGWYWPWLLVGFVMDKPGPISGLVELVALVLP